MDKMMFDAPEEHVSMLRNIQRTPFAKMDDGYRFAHWVFDMNNGDEAMEAIKGSRNGKDAYVLIDSAMAAIREITVTEDDYLAWNVHKKEQGGVAAYHKILHGLKISLLMLAIDASVDMVQSSEHCQADAFCRRMPANRDSKHRQILNRRNPFADVTIKSQQFFYKTGDGGTETLFFNTNNIMERTERNGRDMFSMRPGFLVTKEHGVVQKAVQKVTFANSIAEPITIDEDHIYIHID